MVAVTYILVVIPMAGDCDNSIRNEAAINGSGGGSKYTCPKSHIVTEVVLVSVAVAVDLGSSGSSDSMYPI